MKTSGYRMQKWRSLGFHSSAVSFCFSRQTCINFFFLRGKEISIPGSGERKPVVVLTSPAVCELCFAARFLLALLFLSPRAVFLCVSISCIPTVLPPLLLLCSFSSVPYVLPLSVFFPLLHCPLSVFLMLSPSSPSVFLLPMLPSSPSCLPLFLFILPVLLPSCSFFCLSLCFLTVTSSLSFFPSPSPFFSPLSFSPPYHVSLLWLL